MDSRAIIELRRLTEMVEALKDAQDHLVRRMVSRDERRTGAALWPLAAELVGEGDFALTFLHARALNDRTPMGRAVLELIEDYVDPDTGHLRSLGQLFSRLEGASLGGYRLVRGTGPGRSGERWRLVRVSRAE